MDSSPQVREYLIDMESDIDDISSGRAPTDDQFFLLYFIMGTYFGPDLKGELPQKSVFQRRAEGLPPYTPDKLAGSCMQTVEVERVYYYVLRKADRSVVLKLPWLRKFFHGNLSNSTRSATLAFPQFDDLFPDHLHPHSMFKGQYEVINNIVFISDPETLYIAPEYIKRFKRLTGLEDLRLDREGAKLHTMVDGKVLYNIDVQEMEFHEESRETFAGGSEEIRPSSPISEPAVPLPANGVRDAGTPPINSVPQNNTPPFGCTANNGTVCSCGSSDCLPTEMKTSKLDEPTSDLIFLPSRPTGEEWINILAATKGGCALTGSAAMGQIGPVLGRVDIGECEDSYLFRVSLPGVKRDEREFSCEVEDDGKVSIRGVTITGEKTVCRCEQIFEMQSQKLCPPGHFSISFKLPGPVDPHHFSGNFGTDGILEGIVMKGGKT